MKSTSVAPLQRFRREPVRCNWRAWCTGLAALALLPLSATAQTITSAVPGAISYQGKVSNAAGALVGAGTPVNRTIVFRIWSHPNNSTVNDLVYSEQQTVTISEGEFSVLIGSGGVVSGTPLGYSETAKGPSGGFTIASPAVFGGATRYLGVTIDDPSANPDPEISPRQQLVTSAYAFRAKYAESLGSNGNSAITVTDAGNLGIGNAAPALPLSFASQLGDKISLYGNFNFGLGIQGNNVQLKGHSSSDDITFGYGPSASMTETMRVKGNGNVGIGTNNPTARLDVNGVLNVFDGSKNYPAGIATELGSQLVNFGINDGRFGTQTTAQPGGFMRIDARGLNIPVFQFLTRAANAATPSTAMVIDGSGNVGIGTSTPVAPLSFGNVVGQKISFWNNSSTAIYGIGLQGGLLQIHTDAAGGDVAFGHGASAAFTETMRIKGNGNVGIGTNAPNAKLDVNGGIMIKGNLTNVSSRPPIGSTRLPGEIGAYSSGGVALDDGFLRLSAGGGTSYATKTFIDLSGYSTVGDMSNNMAFGTAGNERMRITSSGRVGIGTSSPVAALHVNGGGSVTGDLSFYIDGFGHGGRWTTNPYTRGDVSIYASNSIVCPSGFFVISDARTKNVLGVSEGKADLDTLSKIQITNYTFRDVPALGPRVQKKVVAQQLEQVFPEAVSQFTEVVADIYQPATISDGWIQLTTDLRPGERVRLITEAGTKDLHEVLEVRADGFRTASPPAGEKVFVYGREVSDFRSVDYDAIAMLNVSATQELKREKDAEIADLKKRVAELESKDRARDAKLAAIEKLLSSSSTVMALPAKPATANGQE